MEKMQAFSKTLERHRGESHLVILHDYPDPDAIASAFAHRLISSSYGINVEITYTGKISHNQNVALVKLLGIDLIPYDGKLDLNRYQGSIFLDNQGTTVNGIVKALESARVPVLFIIDHHEPQNLLVAEFSDIQKVGSTSTIFTSYIEQGLFKLDRGNKDHVAVATALMHGIMTDTSGFIHAGDQDYHAAGYLSGFRDGDMLDQIMNQAHSKKVMDVINRALENRTVIENHSIAGIGYLRAGDRDAIPQAAEFLMKEENVHTAIVYGIVKDESQEEILNGSLRTSKLTLDPDDFIKSVFGANSDGRFYGGGKNMAGGFAIPIGFLSGEPSEDFLDLKWQVFDTQVKTKLFARIGVSETETIAVRKQSAIR